MRHIRRQKTFVTLLFLFIAANWPANAESNGQDNFNPSGTFHVAKPQKEEFDSDFLASIELEKRRGRGGGFAGSLSMIRPNNTYAEFAFVATITSSRKFAFTTNLRSGINYSFSGKFLRGGNYVKDYVRDSSQFDGPVMEGTLTKFKDGRKVAEGYFRFTFTAEG